ncbi:MAG TPA: peptidylprolyl isomerase [Ktedonobacterales bacterium]|nr:peptidylprolyl isomerase [Ktedonobacterales bacterium]
MKMIAARARTRSLALLLGALVFAVLLAGCGAAASADPIWAVKVNGHGYSLATYQHLVRALRAIDAYNNSSSPSASDWQSPTGRANRGSAEQRAVSTLTELEIAREKTQTLRITVTQQAINASEQALKNSVAQLVRQNPTDPTVKQVQAAITSDVLTVLAEQNADEQALTNSPKVTLPAVRLRVLVVNTQAEAQQYQQQAQHGSDFGALAKAHSLDTTTAPQGGDVGQVFRGQLPATFDKPIFSLNVPANGKQYVVVKSGTEYVLCEVSQRGDAAVQSLQHAQSRVSPLGVWLAQYTSIAKVHTYVTGV